MQGCICKIQINQWDLGRGSGLTMDLRRDLKTLNDLKRQNGPEKEKYETGRDKQTK